MFPDFYEVAVPSSHTYIGAESERVAVQPELNMIRELDKSLTLFASFTVGDRGMLPTCLTYHHFVPGA
jgi:hypothetical protein